MAKLATLEIHNCCERIKKVKKWHSVVSSSISSATIDDTSLDTYIFTVLF